MQSKYGIMLQHAVAMHSKGKLAEAMQCYDQVIFHEPGCFDALHLRGVVTYQIGNYAESILFFNKAIKQRADVAMAYNSRGLALHAVADFCAALKDFEKAIEINPNFAEAFCNKAISLRKMGRLSDAEISCSNAIRLNPNVAIFYNSLGAILKDRTDLTSALKSFARAIEINPEYIDALNNQGKCLFELANFEEALKCFDRVLNLNNRDAEAHRIRGNTLKELNRLNEALVSYDNAISQKPDFAEAYINRGVVLNELNRHNEALVSYDIAISQKPDFVEAYINRGVVLKELNRLNEAIASCEKAISLKPDQAFAWFGLAQIFAEIGKFDEAEVGYRKAYDLDAKFIEPLCGIVEVKKFDDRDPLIAEIETLLSDVSLSTGDHVQLHHAYAKICNDLGRYDDAFNHYCRGKRLIKSEFRVDMLDAGYAAMRRLFSSEFFAERIGFGLPDERPVFIVGMPRSGTTLTENILSSHSLVDGLGELKDLPNIAKAWCGSITDPSSLAEAVVSLKPRDVIRMAEQYLEAYVRSSNRSIRVIDKLPHNYEWLGLIVLMFPKARIIHCRRNPLDNCVSMYMQNFKESHGYNQDLSVLGRYYREYVRLMDHWSSVLPVPIFDQVYENTVGDLEASARSLVSFLGLEWDPNCLRYHENDRKVSTPSRWQVRQHLYDKSVGRWRLYEKHIGPLISALSV